MTERLEGYRKLFAVITTALIVFILRQFGMDAGDLAVYGITLSDMQVAIVDWLIQVGVPVVFMAAQPEQWGDTITRHWRWIVGGGAIVAALVGVAVLVM